MGIDGSDPNNTAHGRNGGYTIIIPTSVIRPNDVDVYAAGDVYADKTSDATVLTFALAGREVVGNSGIINSIQLNVSANQSTLPAFALWLFDAEPTTAGDNAAFVPTDTEINDTLIGIVTFDADNHIGNAGAAAAGNYILQARNVNLSFVCASESQDIYGILVVLNAYTPIAVEEVTAKLAIFQD